MFAFAAQTQKIFANNAFKRNKKYLIKQLTNIFFCFISQLCNCAFALKRSLFDVLLVSRRTYLNNFKLNGFKYIFFDSLSFSYTLSDYVLTLYHTVYFSQSFARMGKIMNHYECNKMTICIPTVKMILAQQQTPQRLLQCQM